VHGQHCGGSHAHQQHLQVRVGAGFWGNGRDSVGARDGHNLQMMLMRTMQAFMR
jgi:hypothetical protein